MKNIAFSILFILIVSGFLSESYSQEAKIDSVPKFSFGTVPELWQQIDDIFNDPNFSNANWGVVIQSLVTGEYFYKKNENKLFIPASNLKLFTTSAALNILGADYKFKTELHYKGKLDGPILRGDLVVRGFGDPTISGRFFNEDIYKVFNDWADSLLELGIDEISGNIVGDDNAFDNKGLGKGWAWDYETDWYAAPTSAISFNDNCVDLLIKPTRIGQKAEIKITPETKYIVLINNVITVPNDSDTAIKIYRERGTNVINVYGTITQKNSPYKAYATVNNPTQYSMIVLKEVLLQKGIKVNGFPIDIDDISRDIDFSDSYYLFSYYSLPLKDIIKVINKNSQNFFAEQLMKVIGYEVENYGTIANGVDASENIFNQMGINTDNIAIFDGSGLSRMNLITPNQFVTLLNYMYRSDDFIYFYNSLPIAGIDGTLANRMRKTRAQNNVRAKTGFVYSVRSLCGYAYTGDKEPIAFSIIVNNFTVPVVLADNIQDLVCNRLANFKRK
ncbi:MAG: D-alanyl-D-alanine carboxypeptidase/D-alanyl-D-alanine-endopeptidase [Ignavibacteria bacterium]|jgi:D-alanyl-D-alanine carboxypeptidase/D-alanyl-D-alanine-endopeptidase (penicillin-binding protein 4)|nr:D-alanyl-D-alanine carboxypeptidase/D-alanyl-D-alanine-endopeptidase [Ignavibacteria bacterium]